MLEVWAELLGCYALQGYDGSLSASAREKSLISFQEGSGQRILVATDSVARGLHINGVEAVINVDFPPTVVEYLHRLGLAAFATSAFPMSARKLCFCIVSGCSSWNCDAVYQMQMSYTFELAAYALSGQDAPADWALKGLFFLSCLRRTPSLQQTSGHLCLRELLWRNSMHV